jgi:hypothetical protein
MVVIDVAFRSGFVVRSSMEKNKQIVRKTGQCSAAELADQSASLLTLKSTLLRLKTSFE